MSTDIMEHTDGTGVGADAPEPRASHPHVTGDGLPEGGGDGPEAGAKPAVPGPRRSRGWAGVVALVLALAGLAAFVYRDRLFGAGDAAETAGERKILYWVDPMHPAYTSDKPGIAPDCGMDLVPVYADGGPGTSSLPPGVVQISAEKQQLIGVKIGEVTAERVAKTIRAVGRLAYDETKVARVHAKYDGWVERVHADFTGQLVREGDPLVDLYSPELYQAQQEFLLARRGREELSTSGVAGVPASGDALFGAARRRLELLDVTPEQIAELERRGTATRTVTIFAPATGFVTAKSANLKQRVTADTELYALSDLSTVWVVADVYEYESAQVRPGQAASVTLSAFPGRTFRGRVSYIYPDLNAETRTLKVRVDVANPRFELKPDMYADVELSVDFGTQVLVPEEAVMRSGLKDTVFVALDGGFFEPRQVTLGERANGRYVVLSGLVVGERVVTSGNFLIDSESQLKSAAASMGDPHAGHGGAAPAGADHSEHGAAPAGPAADHSGHRAAPGAPAVDHSKHQPSPAPRSAPPAVDHSTMDHSKHGAPPPQKKADAPKKADGHGDHSGHEGHEPPNPE
jgi:Cu(I)/Ag(I) efflux system membrane fusion protein